MTWRLQATVGDLDFDVTPREHDDPPPELPALLTATWRDALVDDGSWPAIQDASTGQLTLLFETAAEAADLTAMTPVSLRLFRSNGVSPMTPVEVGDNWRYATGLSSSATFADPTFDDSGWAVGASPFGWGPNPSEYGTITPSPLSLWTRQHITTSGGDLTLTTPLVDNNAWVYLDGVLIWTLAYPSTNATITVPCPAGDHVVAVRATGDGAIQDSSAFTIEEAGTGAGEALVAWFAGRTSDPEMEPVVDGVEVTLLLSDYLSDLGEHTRGDVDYPAENVLERLDRMFNAEALAPPPPPEVPSGWILTTFGLVARPKSPASLLSLAQEAIGSALYGTLNSDVFDVPGPGGLGLYELRPNVDTTTWLLDAATPWVQVPLPRVSEGDAEPIPASAVTFGAKWRRSKFTDVNTVHITTGGQVVARVNNRVQGEPRALYRRETQVSSEANAEKLARYMLPDEWFEPSWEADTFIVHLDRAADDWWPGSLRDVRTLTGLQTRHNPNGSDSWTGVLTALDVAVAHGRLTVDVTLSSRPAGVLTIDGGGAAGGPDAFLDGGHAGTTEWETSIDLGASS